MIEDFEYFINNLLYMGITFAAIGGVSMILMNDLKAQERAKRRIAKIHAKTEDNLRELAEEDEKKGIMAQKIIAAQDRLDALESDGRKRRHPSLFAAVDSSGTRGCKQPLSLPGSPAVPAARDSKGIEKYSEELQESSTMIDIALAQLEADVTAHESSVNCRSNSANPIKLH